MPEQAGLWTGGGECEPNAACGLDDASAYFSKFFAQGRELGDGQRARRMSDKRLIKSIARLRKALEKELSALNVLIGDQIEDSNS
jgi:hypothetical protein